MASLSRDLLTSYLASFTRIASWVGVSALVYRHWGERAFGMLAVVRSTLGILNYTSLGLAPAMIHYLAKARAAGPVAVVPIVPAEIPEGDRVLPYGREEKRTPPMLEPTAEQRLHFTGLTVAWILLIVGVVILALAVPYTDRWIRVAKGLRDETPDLVFAMGFGILLRILSDAAGATIQARGKIWLDNLYLVIADVVWVVSFAISIRDDEDQLPAAGWTFAGAAAVLLVARYVTASRLVGVLGRMRVAMRTDGKLILPLLTFGGMVTLAQLADFLYAPTDFLLINHLLRDPAVLASYVPAVQIDAGLLLVVAGLSSVLLPRAARAHAASDAQSLRRYYVRGTLGSVAMLAAACGVVWVAAPVILSMWLGEVPAGTLGILPLVLVHTLVGGASGVGRSVLLGMGRVKALTASVLAAGVLNVALSYTFVAHFHLGLRGIVYGTLIAVTLRCAVWLPWYTLRAVRRTQAVGAADVVPATVG